MRKSKGHVRVMTCNVNGIRAAARKGFFEWFEKQKIDVACLQEVRATPDQITDTCYWPKGYHCYYEPAEKKGYSGVAIYSKEKPDSILTDWGHPLSKEEGRYIVASFGDLDIASLYLLSGTSGEDRQELKYKYMDAYLAYLKKHIKKKNKKLIIGGDWNIAHTQKDIKNWKANQKNSGFLPEERAWLDTLFDKVGYVDAFRCQNQEADQYTWWSQRGRARDNNVGWRIDYQIITPNLKESVQQVAIDSRERFSDHAPLIIDYALD